MCENGNSFNNIKWNSYDGVEWRSFVRLNLRTLRYSSETLEKGTTHTSSLSLGHHDFPSLLQREASVRPPLNAIPCVYSSFNIVFIVTKKETLKCSVPFVKNHL